MKQKKKQKLVKAKAQKERLLKMVTDSREEVKGYIQLAQVHSAYISILLNKLGATEDKPITITSAEVTEALEKYEARAMPAEEGFNLWCEVSD